MIVYKLAPDKLNDPLKEEDESKQSQLRKSLVKAHQNVISRYLDENKFNDFTIKLFNPLSKLSLYNIELNVSITSIDEAYFTNIIHGVLEGDIYIKIRDNSFRFIQFGMDYIVYICCGHDDIQPITKDAGLLMSNVTLMLGHTDIFDI